MHQGITKEVALTPESWSKIQSAAKEPMIFLTHPRNLVKYAVVQSSVKKG